MTQREYSAPELKLAGKADEVIQGALSVGFDFDSQQADSELEFLADESGRIQTR